MARETVRYEVDDGEGELVLLRYVAVRRSIEGLRYTEFRRYRDGRLNRFWVRTGRPKLNLPPWRTPGAAYEAWHKGAMSHRKCAEREAKNAREMSKLKMPKDW